MFCLFAEAIAEPVNHSECKDFTRAAQDPHLLSVHLR